MPCDEALARDGTSYVIEVTGVEAWVTPETTTGGFSIRWVAQEIGFGELSIFFKEGRWSMDADAMSNRFADAVFLAFRKWLVRRG